MSRASELLTAGQRSERAKASDAHQGQLATQRQRVFAITFWSLVLIEAALWYFDGPEWLLFAAPLAWLGLLVHNNALLILHELWEINDQLAGRKDEFAEVVTANRLHD